MSKKKEYATVKFIGMNSEDVTGSMTSVKYKNNMVLLDCGYYQCKNKMKQYSVNARNLDFKVKDLDNILISHLNLDHYGLLPRLFELGCNAKVFIPKNSKAYLKVAFEDSLKIQKKDLEFIKKNTGKRPKDLYTEIGVQRTLDNIIEVDFGAEMYINEYISLVMQPAYHILNSSQIELFINDKSNNYKKKIYYSGDLGNLHIEKPFLNGFKFVENSDLAIMETTYAMNKKIANKKKREKDREKLKTTIDETIEKGGNFIIASFAYQRAQELLYEIYDIYKDDKNFNIPVVLDSPLAVKVTHLFKDMVEDYDKDKINAILNWKNLNLLSDWKDSESCQKDNKSKIICACSGFGESGRIRNWIKDNLPDENSTICFVGYSSEDSLSGIIKNGKKKYLKIDGIEVKNKAKVCNLISFSSHIQHDTMLDLYSKMNTNSVYLVHGKMDNRLEFLELLKEEYSKKCKTTKVFIGSKDLEVVLK